MLLDPEFNNTKIYYRRLDALDKGMAVVVNFDLEEPYKPYFMTAHNWTGRLKWQTKVENIEKYALCRRAK